MMLLFQEYEASIHIRTEKLYDRFLKNMDTLEIYHALRNMRTFSGVFPSDLLPTHSLPGIIRYTIIINTDIHRAW